MQVVYQRCAAIEVGKDVIAVAVRLPGDGPDGRATVKRTFKTFYGVLAEAARWLVSLGVTHVAMEATDLQHAGWAKQAQVDRGLRPGTWGPRTSRTVRLIRSHNASGHLGVHGRPHVSIAVVTRASAAWPLCPEARYRHASAFRPLPPAPSSCGPLTADPALPRR